MAYLTTEATKHFVPMTLLGMHPIDCDFNAQNDDVI